MQTLLTACHDDLFSLCHETKHLLAFECLHLLVGVKANIYTSEENVFNRWEPV